MSQRSLWLYKSNVMQVLGHAVHAGHTGHAGHAAHAGHNSKKVITAKSVITVKKKRCKDHTGH